MFDRKIENWMLAARWLLVPFYAVLLVALVPLFFMLIREFKHLMPMAFGGPVADVVLAMLSMLDLVLLANLVMMVAVSSFESYVSRIEVSGRDKPEWLGKLDSGRVKVRVAVSVTLIAAVNLLRDFMKEESPRELIFSGAVLLSFCIMSFMIARTGSDHSPGAEHPRLTRSIEIRPEMPLSSARTSDVRSLHDFWCRFRLSCP
jgi:uncharacterized protein (TIGR00645 family)